MGQIILISLDINTHYQNILLITEEFDGITKSYETNCQLLRITDLDDSSSINIYLKNFNSKEQVISLIEQV